MHFLPHLFSGFRLLDKGGRGGIKALLPKKNKAFFTRFLTFCVLDIIFPNSISSEKQ